MGHMATVSQALAQALDEHRAGRLPAAERICRQILQVDPTHAEVLHLLGVIALQRGDAATAVEYIGRAIGVSDRQAFYHSNLGEAYRRLRRYPEAIACYQRAVRLNPSFAGAYYNLGNALRDRKEMRKAVACYRRALRLQPDMAGAHNNLGNALKDLHRPEEAVACYRRALALEPRFAEAHNNLGNAL